MEDKEVLRIYQKVYDYLDDFNIYEVRNIARAFGVNAPTTAKKKDLILTAIRVGAGISEPGPRSNKGARVKASDAPPERIAAVRSLLTECNRELTYVGAAQPPVELRFRDSEETGREYGYGDSCASGVLEIGRQGHGFLRGKSFLPGEGDAIVSDKLIERYRLRDGDIVGCYVAKEGNSAPEAVQIASINGGAPVFVERKKFDEIPVLYPEERFSLGQGGCLFLRAADIVCPVCRGQRGILYAPAGSGRTAFFREAAHAFLNFYPETKLIMVLLDLRPEELTEAEELGGAAVIAASFEDAPARAVQAARLALEHAKRVAEEGGDTVILIDSISALVRALSYSTPPSGVATAGGVDLAALGAAKKFFSSARRLKGAGSVTILATALKGRGVAMDADVGEDIGGVANMFVNFEREIAARGVFPAIDFSRSYTKRAESFQTEEEQRCAFALRNIASGKFGAEHVRELLSKTKTNEEFIARSDLWSGAVKE